MADKQLNEQQLQALLRIKRYEQPPPGYFDDLLHSIHRRQREEMLRRPAWRLFFERIGAFFASLRKDWSYVGSMVCVVMIGVGVIQMILPRRVPVQTMSFNSRPSLEAFILPTLETSDDTGIAPGDLVFRPNPTLRPVNIPRNSPRINQRALSFPVHYAIDTQPSNYDPPTQVRF